MVPLKVGLRPLNHCWFHHIIVEMDRIFHLTLELADCLLGYCSQLVWKLLLFCYQEITGLKTVPHSLQCSRACSRHETHCPGCLVALIWKHISSIYCTIWTVHRCHFQFLPETRLFPLQHHLQSDILSELFSQMLEILI